MAVALITGSGQGIGAAIALKLAKDGFDIAINDVNEAQLEKGGYAVAQQCKALGVKAECFAADVSKYDQCEQMVKQVKEKWVVLMFC